MRPDRLSRRCVKARDEEFRRRDVNAIAIHARRGTRTIAALIVGRAGLATIAEFDRTKRRRPKFLAVISIQRNQGFTRRPFKIPQTWVNALPSLTVNELNPSLVGTRHNAFGPPAGKTF